LGIRVRGLYCTKDTFVSTALRLPQLPVAWLEQQTGVAYATLRRHYGKLMPTDRANGLRLFESLDPGLFCPRSGTATGKSRVRGMRGGGLEPPRVFSPLAPQTSASASSAILARPSGGRVT